MTSTKPCSCHSDDSPESIGEAVVEGSLVRSVFRIPGMDCPSEEQMIRLRLGDMPIISLVSDLPARSLVICHGGEVSDIMSRLEPLGYGAELVESSPLGTGDLQLVSQQNESKTLWILLAINSVMFVIEVIAGWLADSAGLIADGADMFADAAVYGTALYAVGRDVRHKLSAARLAGVLQLSFALWTLIEVARRVSTGSFPEEIAMIGIALLALAANIACLVLISRHREGGIHMRASYIFSANDVLANLGVILAGVMIAWTGSPIPDWIIGGLIGLLVLTGAVRILRLR